MRMKMEEMHPKIMRDHPATTNIPRHAQTPNKDLLGQLVSLVDPSDLANIQQNVLAPHYIQFDPCPLKWKRIWSMSNPPTLLGQGPTPNPSISLSGPTL
jgi:hypothetical protein